MGVRLIPPRLEVTRPSAADAFWLGLEAGLALASLAMAGAAARNRQPVLEES